MKGHKAPLVVHVGYPKTATTTFQQHVFPHHFEIEYLGKHIPSYRYLDDRLYGLIDELLHRNQLMYNESRDLRLLIDGICTRTDRRCVLISSESCIHPSVSDIATIADRLHSALAPCKILITIREQISAILSFYWMHGRFGQYLTIGPKEESIKIRYPIPFRDWISFQKSAYDQNYLSTLHYHSVVKYYIDRFGADHVRVLLYEAFRGNPDDYASELGNFLNVNVATLRELISDKHELRSHGRLVPWESNRAPILNDERDYRWIIQTLQGLFRHRRIDSSDSTIEDILLELREAYRSDNTKLARDLSLPLASFGYCI